MLYEKIPLNIYMSDFPTIIDPLRFDFSNIFKKLLEEMFDFTSTIPTTLSGVVITKSTSEIILETNYHK